MMQYWRLRVNPALNADYEVYYKSLINLSQHNVPRAAVTDGDLLDVFLPKVDKIEQISEQEYYEHMND